MSQARSQKKAAARQADLARRQAAVQNQASAQAATSAATRERIANQVQENQALANEQMNTTVDAQINMPEASKRRTTQKSATYRADYDETGALRI